MPLAMARDRERTGFYIRLRFTRDTRVASGVFFFSVLAKLLSFAGHYNVVSTIELISSIFFSS